MFMFVLQVLQRECSVLFTMYSSTVQLRSIAESLL